MVVRKVCGGNCVSNGNNLITNYKIFFKNFNLLEDETFPALLIRVNFNLRYVFFI